MNILSTDWDLTILTKFLKNYVKRHIYDTNVVTDVSLMKPSWCYLLVIALRTQSLKLCIRFCGQGEWVWQWHVCTEPITWSRGHGDNFWFWWLFFFQFQVHNTSSSSWPGYLLSQDSWVLWLWRNPQQMQTIAEGTDRLAVKDPLLVLEQTKKRSSQDGTAKHPKWRSCWWW